MPSSRSIANAPRQAAQKAARRVDNGPPSPIHRFLTNVIQQARTPPETHETTRLTRTRSVSTDSVHSQLDHLAHLAYPLSTRQRIAHTYSWIAEHAPQGCRIGVEGALGFAFALVEHLLGEGLEVVEVPAHLTRRETKYLHGQGRSDPRDALAIARVTLREHKLPALRPAGPNRSLKLVHDYRRQLTVERSRTANRLHADLHALYPGYRVRIPNLIRVRHLAAATRLLRGDQRTQASLARRRLTKLRHFDREISELTRELTQLVAETHTGLLTHCGIGPLMAARILGEVGDIRRFASKDAFAAGNGTAPIPASSGARHRHRLNRGGNRRLNYALHVMCLTQMRIDPRARAYIARRKAEGKSTAEAMRSLKRHLSDIIYNQLQADLRTPHQSPPLT